MSEAVIEAFPELFKKMVTFLAIATGFTKSLWIIVNDFVKVQLFASVMVQT